MKICSLPELLDEIMDRPATLFGLDQNFRFFFFTEDEIKHDQTLYPPDGEGYDDERYNSAIALFRFLGPVAGLNSERLSPCGPTSYDETNLAAFIEECKDQAGRPGKKVDCGPAGLASVRRAITHSIRAACKSIAFGAMKSSCLDEDHPEAHEGFRWMLDVLTDGIITGLFHSYKDLKASAKDFLAQWEGVK